MTAPTRRERIRSETIAEIKAAALAQVAESGAASLSIRGVARAIGMSPAGLYRYYSGRDALLTDLITDAYDDLADGVQAATTGGGTPWQRFAAGVRAYRAWAIADPNRFLLLFGTPVPGYAAPQGGPTVAANRRMGQAFFAVAAEAWMHGDLVAPDLGRRPTEGEVALARELESGAPGFPASLVPLLVGTWSHWHGLVTLEVTNQLDWIYPRDREVLMETSINQMLVALGAS